MEDHFYLTTKTLLSLYYYYCTISYSTFQTKCYARNSYSHILFCNIFFAQSFCYRLAVLPMKEKFPEMLNNVLWVQSLCSAYQNFERCKLWTPSIGWAWSNNSDSSTTRRGYSRIQDSPQPAVTFVYPASASFNTGVQEYQVMTWGFCSAIW